jgi:hypothetical protein
MMKMTICSENSTEICRGRERSAVSDARAAPVYLNCVAKGDDVTPVEHSATVDPKGRSRRPLDAKTDYLIRELWTLAWGASVQRAKVYRPGIKPDSKAVKTFRRDVATYVASKLLPMYGKPCDENQHYNNIEALVTYATAAGRGVLSPAGYKFGVAQKLLNLCLKYHWCLALIAEPPHCPVDRIVIGKTRFRGKLNWTEINTRAKYREVIEDIGRIAKSERLSIAQWELQRYARR